MLGFLTKFRADFEAKIQASPRAKLQKTPPQLEPPSPTSEAA
jgi:hypothetical protein